MNSKIRQYAKIAIYSSATVRRIKGLMLWLLGHTRLPGTAHLIEYKEDDAVGPLQQSEALLLFAACRVIAPETIVEFGFLNGQSASNFLKGAPNNARVYSFDISEDSKKIALARFRNEKRFRFVEKSQTEFEPADIEHRKVDLVFFDASHNVASNVETYNRIRPSLGKDAIICIHDTGLWQRSTLKPLHWNYIKDAGEQNWVNPLEYAHQKEEREFVNIMLTQNPDLEAIHFHSTRVLRHGLTILQFRRLLDMP